MGGIFSISCFHKNFFGFVIVCGFLCPSYLAKISFSSCSETNWPKLATKSVEHGALAAIGGLGGCWEPPFEPTGLANAGLGKKWPDAAAAPADDIIDGWCIVAAAWCGCKVNWGWKYTHQNGFFLVFASSQQLYHSHKIFFWFKRDLGCRFSFQIQNFIPQAQRKSKFF